MLIQPAQDIRSSEITPKSLYLRRREFIQASAAALVGAGVGAFADPVRAQGARTKLLNVQKSALSTTEAPNTFEHITSYNNFYEFGPRKEDPKPNSRNFKPLPWQISVEGLVDKPAVYDYDDFLKGLTLEERIYRFRCVEAWSMVIPWVGIPLASIIKRLNPSPKAKFVEFVTLLDPKQFPMQRSGLLDWPYVEGLRMDEAMHPLTILSVGLYGEVLPPQNGAPIRLVVPWKYGFKSIKSIVKIRFVETMPTNTWKQMASSEYGFYANVNPMVDHPRWSQARERKLPALFQNTPTKLFNGYDQVASLYTGLDLRKNY